MNRRLVVTKVKPTPGANDQLKKKVKKAKSDLKRAQEKLEQWKEFSNLHEKIHAERVRPEIEKYFLTKKRWLISLVEVLDKYDWNELEEESITSQILDTIEELEGRFLGDIEYSELVSRFEDSDDDWNFQDVEGGENDDSAFSSKEFEKLIDQEQMDFYINEAVDNLGFNKEDFDDCESTPEVIARIQAKINAKRMGEDNSSAPLRSKNSSQLKDLYRKLASLIHPDKEIDPIAKASKTELMQKLNTAYRNNDIESLMHIQSQAAIDFPVDLLSTEEGLKATLEHTKNEFQRIKRETESFMSRLKQNLGIAKSHKKQDVEIIIEQTIAEQCKSIVHQQQFLEIEIVKHFSTKKTAKALIRRWVKEDQFFGSF
jgi:hypothetical protein